MSPLSYLLSELITWTKKQQQIWIFFRFLSSNLKNHHIVAYFIYNTHLLINTLLHPQVITASLTIDIKLNKKRKRNDKQFYNVMAKKVKVSKFPDDQSLPKSSTHGTTHRQTQPKGRDSWWPQPSWRPKPSRKLYTQTNITHGERIVGQVFWNTRCNASSSQNNVCLKNAQLQQRRGKCSTLWKLSWCRIAMAV